jgi:hypothetical protein
LSSNVSLTIHNGLLPLIILPTLITVAGATGGTIDATDRTLLFPYTSDNTGTGQTQYSFTTTENLSCDVLIVAGGGGGGMNAGAGGGAGGLILLENITLPTGTYTNYIKVGNGGDGGTVNTTGTLASNGKNTIFGTYTAIGGGAGVNSGGANGNAGGSGGGAGDDSITGNKVGGDGTLGQGFKGGNGTVPGGASRTAGGGGGAGGEGQASVSTTRAGDGGIGRNMSSIFGTSVGQSGWFAGGGGGGVHSGTGGTGGTGGGGSENVDGTNGTGGGGGAGRSPNAGRRGGSGIVIIRYRKPIITTSSSIELVRGTVSDSNRDYKIGNYNSEFKVISSVSSIDTDYIRITSAGSIFNPTGTANWNTGSDRRIKENIERASYDKCYDNINKLELNRFNYVEGFNTVSRDNKQLGFIAQEVYDIFPKAISSQGYYTDTLSIPDLLSIDVSQINYSLYGAVKKLIEINNEKDERIKTLGYQLKTLETFLNIDIDTSSNIALDTSNILMDTSNITLDTSNISIDTSNIS